MLTNKKQTNWKLDTPSHQKQTKPGNSLILTNVKAVTFRVPLPFFFPGLYNHSHCTDARLLPGLDLTRFPLTQED